MYYFLHLFDKKTKLLFPFEHYVVRRFYAPKKHPFCLFFSHKCIFFVGIHTLSLSSVCLSWKTRNVNFVKNQANWNFSHVLAGDFNWNEGQRIPFSFVNTLLLLSKREAKHQIGCVNLPYTLKYKQSNQMSVAYTGQVQFSQKT